MQREFNTQSYKTELSSSVRMLRQMRITNGRSHVMVIPFTYALA